MDDNQAENVVDINEFFNENHRLFTVIGVFGALAVYLVEIGYSGNGLFKQGVGGALLLFLMTSLIGVRNAFSNLKIANSNLNISYMLLYSAVVYALLGLSLTIVVTMAERFPEGSGTAIAGAVVYTTIIVYSSYVILSTSLTNFEDSSILGTISPYIPQISFVIFLILLGAAWSSGEVYQNIGESPSQSVGVLWGSALVHSVITVTIYGVFRFLSALAQIQGSN